MEKWSYVFVLQNQLYFFYERTNIMVPVVWLYFYIHSLIVPSAIILCCLVASI